MSGQFIMRHLRRGAGGLLLAVLATAAPAQSERSIEAIDHVALDTNSVRITLTFDGPAPEEVEEEAPPRCCLYAWYCCCCCCRCCSS